MRDTGFDIEQVLQRRFNWGKGSEAKGQNFAEYSIIDEMDNRFASLKKKI